MVRPFPSCLAVLTILIAPLPADSAFAGPGPRRPAQQGVARARSEPRVVTVTAQRRAGPTGRVRWVDVHRTAPPSSQPPAGSTDVDLRGWLFSVGPWGFASYYVVPPYDGPRMEEGYGRGYDALGYRYGLEEEYFEQRYNPYYNAFGPLEADATGAVHHVGRLRGSDIATPGRHLNLRDMNRRAERLLEAHQRAYALGVRHLRRGEYARAIVSFTLAARLNQSDPASRLMLALARLGQGHYAEAAAAFRRAAELQPQLVYLELPLGRYYPRPGVLADVADGLAGWVQQHRAQIEARYLLGYLRLHQGRLAEAYAALREAATLRPDDRLVRDLLEVARPPAGAKP